jgi:DNA-binding CsgD family transcriptional regulator
MVDEDLVAAIEEAALTPENWPRVLERLAAIVGSDAAAVTARGPAGLTGTIASPSYADAHAAYLARGRTWQNVRPQRALAAGYAGFLTDLEICTPEELEADPIYREFLKPFGFGWTAGTAVPVPSGDIIIFDLARRASDGPFDRAAMERLDPYRPYLARAALLASRQGLERARATTDAMALIGLPAAVLAAGGRVLSVNTPFEQLEPRVVARAMGLVGLADPQAEELLRKAVAAVEQASSPVPRSVPMAATEEGPAIIAHLVPLRRSARDIFAGGQIVMLVTEVVAPGVPETALLTGLFDLTPAESRLARAVAAGITLPDIAAAGGTSIGTLRTQLKSVMAKTGTRRQVDLVRLLLGAAPPSRLH